MPFRNFTTEWYQRVLNDSQYLDGLLNSLMVSVTVSLLATTLAFFVLTHLLIQILKEKVYLTYFFNSTCCPADFNRNKFKILSYGSRI